jgi:hypothetical protein
MNETSNATPPANDPAQTVSQVASGVRSADDQVAQGVGTLARVHQARLSRATRTLATLTAELGSTDAQVITAKAAVDATKSTIARVTLAGRQLTAPAVQVAAGGWALHGRVVDAQFQAATRFTVFLVDASKSYLRQYGFAYTDDTGYFLINAPAAAANAPAAPQLFVEVADTKANPVYLSATPFVPALGSATYQTIVLPAGGQAIGDPPPEIRRVALPPDDAKKT